MSGGYWNHEDSRLHLLYEDVYNDIKGRLREDHSYFTEHELSILTMASITSLQLIGLLRVHMQRLDWLYSGDDGFETFEECLFNDLNKERNKFVKVEKEIRELLYKRLKNIHKGNRVNNDDNASKDQ